MVRISKFVLGIQPSQKMFRVGSLAGTIIDDILAVLGDKALGETYFTEVGKNTDLVSYQLSNPEEGNFLRIEEGNVIFTKDFYASEKHIDLEKSLDEWRFLWKIINGVLSVHGIRRIGVAAEHQFEATEATANNKLLSGLVSGSHPMHAGKFNLQYEDRRPATSKSGLPDPKKDAFINVIRNYYDSELDTEHSRPGYINANLDVQKYFSPLFNGNVFDEVAILFKQFQKEKTAFDADIKQRGLI